MLVGILADTHIPFRVASMPEAVLHAFKDVNLILHAGDVDEPWALAPLEEIAPVLAVSGNYHIFDRSSGGKEFPSVQKVSLCGYNIVMTHGHRIGWTTLIWRIFAVLSVVLGKVDSPLRDRFTSKTLMKRFPEADIIVFGHTHRYFCQQYKNRLVINPGAACLTSYFTSMSEITVALLTLESGKLPVIERVDLQY